MLKMENINLSMYVQNGGPAFVGGGLILYNEFICIHVPLIGNDVDIYNFGTQWWRMQTLNVARCLFQGVSLFCIVCFALV